MVREADHSYLGRVYGTEIAYLIHKSLTRKHIHIVAPPNYGKSEKILIIAS